MRTMLAAMLVFGWTTLSGSVRAEEKADARAVVDKAIEAAGGEAELKKLRNTMVKMKGTIQAQGVEVGFSGDVSVSGENNVRADIEIEVANMKLHVVNVVNKDQGWTKIGENTKEMDKDQLAEAHEQGNVGRITGLAPLKDKTYTLSLVGEDKVDKTPVTVIRVSRKGRRDVSLFFDQKTHLLLKTESRVKDEATGQEVSEEKFFSEYNDKGLRQPRKVVVKRDGKAFMEAETSELKVDEKFDDGAFAKP